MHVTIQCPKCKSAYQVKSDLVGKLIRCPNDRCPHTFEVQPQTGSSPPSPPAPRTSSQQSGSVADIIPMASSKKAEPPAPTQNKLGDSVPVVPSSRAPKEASWQDAPPGSEDEKSEATSAPKVMNWRDAEPAPKQDSPADPKEVSFAEAGAPPIQGAEQGAEHESTVPVTATDAHLDETKRRRAKRMMMLISGAVVVILLGAGVGLYLMLRETEEGVRAEAEKAYRDANDRLEKARKTLEASTTTLGFGLASQRYDRLIKHFDDSPDLEQYRFMKELSLFRGQVTLSNAELPTVFEKTNAFLEKHKESEFLKAHALEVLHSFLYRLEMYLKNPGKKVEPEMETEVDQAETMIQSLNDRFPKLITPEEMARITEGFNKLRAAIALERKRRAVIAEMKELLKKPSAEALRTAKRIVRERSREIPNLEDDAEAKQVIEDLYKGHLDSIKFVSAKDKPNRRKRIDEELESSIIITPYVRGPRGIRNGERFRKKEHVLALARGVLYLLNASTGSVRWARRVGIDSTILPLRLPVSPENPTELILVLSTDTQTLTALDLSERTVWEYRLGSPALGRPVLIRQHAFVTTFNGEVHEIDLTTGKLIGRYDLGQNLSVGGAHRRLGKSDLLYIPADDSCVYVLDVTNRKCKMILYTEHPSGSIRSRPLLVGEALIQDELGAKDTYSYMVLNQTDGLDATEMQVIKLPIKDRHQRPLSMRPLPRMKGWTWFQPYHDGEKLVVLSDWPQVGLFGVRLRGNEDNPLFSLLPRTTGDVRPMGENLRQFFEVPPLENESPGSSRGRAQVVHVLDREYWVLALGQLQRLELSWSPQKGPELKKVWDKPLKLGSPLHESQSLEDDVDGLRLFTVTQQLGGTSCFATAIKPDQSKARRILWQRQLGIVCPTEPFHLGKSILALDESGSIFQFDPKKFPDTANTWHAVGSEAIIKSRDRDESQPMIWLEGSDGTLAHQVMTRDNGRTLILREYSSLNPPNEPVIERSLKLRSPLAGDPIRLGDHLLLPLEDGKLYRYTLDLKPAEGGYTWRSRLAPTSARCYLAALNEVKFIASDGRNGLGMWNWPAKEQFATPVLLGRGDGRLKLSERLIGPPLVMPSQNEFRALIPGRGGILTLLEGEKLRVTRTWDLKGQITTTPFLRDGHLLCIVDENRLVCIDPTKDIAKWEHATTGEGIVGRPQIVEDMLIVADRSGRYVGVNPRTGRKFGNGYQVKATVAPSSSPIAFGSNRAFAPLTDGTILLLSLDLLRSSWWHRLFE